MDIKEAIKVLTNFNKWRIDDDGVYEQPDPKLVGQAIDFAIYKLTKLHIMTSLLKDEG